MKKMLLLTTICFLALHAISQTIYVTTTGAGIKDGSSWGNAFDGTQLQSNLSSASSGTSFWVAAGTYYPTTSTTRSISFSIPSGVNIYGGFAGTETLLTQRNSTTNATVLSGDIGTLNTTSDNSYHVVIFNSITSASTLDGFTITKGNANGGSNDNLGGGVLIIGSSNYVTVSKCIITSNIGNTGAGIYVSGTANSSPTIVDCTISSNSASFQGGGAYTNGFGSGITAAVNFTRVVFYANTSTATSHGGGIYNASGSNGTNNSSFTNCVFANNSAGGNRGGGMLNYSNSATTSITITNCTFYNNTSGGSSGGAIYSWNSGTTTTVKNCIFQNNTTAIDNSSSTINVSYSNVQGGYTGTGNFNTTEIFFNTSNLPGGDNIWGTNDDGLMIQYTSPSKNTGTSTGAPLTDIIGNTRSITDVGAYENRYNFTNNIAYVDAAATGTADGASWINSFTNVQTAIDAVRNTSLPVWIKAGTYYPTKDTTGNTSPSDNRVKTFFIPSGTSLYGGFAGTETLLTQRNIATSTTILSGDIGTLNDTSDNCYQVVCCTYLSSSTTIDGFTITKGNASGTSPNDYGGGIYNYLGNTFLTINNCTITKNNAISGAGGMLNYAGNSVCSPTISNCSFTYNNVIGGNSGGGAIENNAYFGTSNPNIINCYFAYNTSVAYGGAIYNYGDNNVSTTNCSPTIANCIFQNNISTGWGGAICNLGRFTYGKSSPIITNCLLYANIGDIGGAICNVGDYGGICLPTITNCTIYNNYASYNAGSIRNASAAGNITNCIIWGNTSVNAASISNSNITPTITYSIIQDGTAGTGNIFTNPLFANTSNAVGADNIWGTSDDGLMVSCASPGKNTGTSTGVPTTDLIGTTRSSTDIGCYENIPLPGDWNGNSTTDWNTSTNWLGNAIPTSTLNVCINSSASQQPLLSTTSNCSGLVVGSGATLTFGNNTLNTYGSFSTVGNISGANGTIVLPGTAAQIVTGNFSINNLTLNNNAGASINSETGNAMIVTGTLAPTVGTFTTNNTLTLASSSISTARVAAGNSSGGYITGNVKVQRWIQGGYRKYRFFSHPFSSAMNLSYFTDSIDITGAISGSNANHFTATTTNSPSSFYFDESLDNGILYGNGTNAGWTAFTSSSSASTIAVGHGVRIFVRGTKGQAGSLTDGTYTPNAVTLSMSSALKQGDFTLSLNYSSAHTYKGWNFVGNPYASNIDWTTVTKTSLNNAIYTYRPSYGGATYASWINGSSTNGGSNIIESNSGFFVLANAASPSIGFHETDKVATTQSNTMFRTNNMIHNRISLTLQSDSTQYADEVIVRFGDDNATDGFDAAFDAYNLPGSSNDLYVLDNAQAKYSIYHGSELKSNSIERRVIKLGVAIYATGSYTITAKTLNAFINSNKVYLKDALNNTLTEITDSIVYHFVVTNDTATQGDNRFSLLFNAKQMAMNIAPSFLMSVSPNPATDKVTITFNNEQKQNTTISISNELGQKIKTIDAGNVQTGTVTINVNGLAKGIYYVSLNDKNTQKLLVE
jgi:hypothetical protein